MRTTAAAGGSGRSGVAHAPRVQQDAAAPQHNGVGERCCWATPLRLALRALVVSPDGASAATMKTMALASRSATVKNSSALNS
jgi:hypothetical protein